MKLYIPDVSDYGFGHYDTWLDRAANLLDTCLTGEERFSDSLGWLDIDKWAGENTLASIEALARNIRERDRVFVLVGVGGSMNAARSVIEAISAAGSPKIVYGGNSISARAVRQMLAQCDGESFSVNVIAKNFETLEPGLAFRVLRKKLYETYGAKAAEHIVATGTAGSALETLCREQQYAFFPFPLDIGGRFTALSNVGLLPMSVAGVDIRELVQGARDMRRQLETQKGADNDAVRYAALRNMLYSAGYRLELLASFEPELKYFAKWWIQLFGESEGKDGKGLFPVSAEYSEELHSIGQFVQDGTPILFETFLDVENVQDSHIICCDGLEDGFKYLNNKDCAEINRVALQSTMVAHSKRLPCIRFTIPRIDAYCFGQMFYFFEFSCYLSGRILGINPFNQPGVEAYKDTMFKALGK